MPEPFDPYYTWLGIPPEEQPPDHYRLLGIKPLEENLDAIEHAADRQMTQLRTFQSGKHSAASQKLLNEVSTAKLTLLNTEKKAKYDREIRHKLKPRAAAKPVKTAAASVAVPLSHDAEPGPIVSTQETSTARTTRQTDARRRRMIVGASIAAAVLLVLLIAFGAWLGSGVGDDVAGESEKSGKPRKGDRDTATPTVPEPLPALADVPWSNVLEKIDLARDTRNPDLWQKNDGELSVTANRNTKPKVQVLMPPLSAGKQYDLQLEFTGTLGPRGIMLIFPAGPGISTLSLASGRDEHVLVLRCGDSTKTNKPVSKSVSCSTEQRHQLDLRVRIEDGTARIQGLLDGNVVATWDGPETALANARKKPMTDRVRLHVGTQSTLTFHVLRVRGPGDAPPVVAVEEPPGETPGETPVEPVGPVEEPAETPVAETPVVETPVVETPVVETPVVETPAPETPVVETPEPSKLPVPPNEQQQEIFAALDEIYDLKKGRTAEEKIELIDELLAVANDPSGVPAEQFVILRKAMDLAGEAGNAELMLDAIDRIEDLEFDFDVLTAKGIVLLDFAKTAKDPATMTSLIDSANQLADDAAAARRYNIAAGVIKAAHAAATRAGSPEQRKLLFERLGELEGLKEQQAAFEASQIALQANPDDPAANLAVGRWLCFVKGDWKQGLAHLAKGNDAAMQQAALRESGKPTDPAAMAQLGDLWFDMAKKAPAAENKGLYTRAAHWYKKVQAVLDTGLARLKADRRLEEIAKIVPDAVKRPKAAKPVAEPGEVLPGKALTAGEWVDLMPKSGGGGRKGRWKRQGDTITVSGKGGQIPLPVVLEGDYDLQVDLAGKSGAVYIGLPIGGRQCFLRMNLKGPSSLAPIVAPDGQKSISRQDKWEPGQKYSILSKVRMTGGNVRIDILLDGQPFLDYSGPLDSAGIVPKVKAFRNEPDLRFYKTNATFHALRARLISGKGALRGSAAPTPGAPGAPAATPGAPAGSLSFAPSRGMEKGKHGYEMRSPADRLRLAQPIETPWALDFTLLAGKRGGGLNVTLDSATEPKHSLIVSMVPEGQVTIRWMGAEKILLAEAPKGVRGKRVQVRLIVREGAVDLMIDGKPVLQATDRRITPKGTITISGSRAYVDKPNLTPM